MLETSKMLFKLLKFDWNLYKQIEENLKSSYFGLVAEKFLVQTAYDQLKERPNEGCMHGNRSFNIISF